MRKIIFLAFALAIAGLAAVISSCQPEELVVNPTIEIVEIKQTSETSILVKVLVSDLGNSEIVKLGVLVNGEREISVANNLVLFDIEVGELAPREVVSIIAFAQNKMGLSKSEEHTFLLEGEEPDPFEGLSVEPNFVKLDSTDAEPYRMTLNVGIRDVIDPYRYSYLIEYSPYTELMYPKEGEPIYREEPQIERVDDYNLNLSLSLDSILYPGMGVAFRVIAINSDGEEFASEELAYSTSKSNFVKELDNINPVLSHLVYDIKADEEGSIYVCGEFFEADVIRRGFIVKFNKDEEVLWRVNSNPPPNFDDKYSSFAIEDGILYAQLGRINLPQGAGFIQAFNTSDGSLVWETKTGDSDPNTYNVAVREGVVYSSGGSIARVSTSGEFIDALSGFTHCVYPIEGGILAGSRWIDDNNYQARLEFLDNDFNSLSVVQDSMKRGDSLTDPFASIVYFEDENLIITVKNVSYLPLPSYNYLEAYTLVDNQLKLVWSKNIGGGRSLRLAKYGKSIAVVAKAQERLRKGPALYDLNGNLIWELGIPAIEGPFTIVGNRMYLVNLATLRRVDLPKL